MNTDDTEIYEDEGLETSGESPVVNDPTFERDDESKLIHRNEKYNEILNIFTNHLKMTKDIQGRYRPIIFWVFSLFFVIIIVGAFWFLLVSEISLESLPAILGVLVSLISAIMIIPSKITDFIFNSKEDEQMAKIISDIQAYDRAIRENKNGSRS